MTSHLLFCPRFTLEYSISKSLKKTNKQTKKKKPFCRSCHPYKIQQIGTVVLIHNVRKKNTIILGLGQKAYIRQTG